MAILRTNKILVLAAAALVAAAMAAVGIAAVTSETVLADGNTLHYRFVRTVASDFDSGWHTHPGLVVVQVQQGSLQFTSQGNCTPKTVNAGDTYIEVPYTPVRATVTGNAVWTTSLIVRAEDPLRTAVTSSCP